MENNSENQCSADRGLWFFYCFSVDKKSEKSQDHRKKEVVPLNILIGEGTDSLIVKSKDKTKISVCKNIWKI